jgi:hypothetical protein
MDDSKKVIRAWVRVGLARDDFMSSQDAVLELSQMADTTASHLDSDEYIAQKLCESLGRADISGTASRTILTAVAHFVETSRALRAKQRSDAVKNAKASAEAGQGAEYGSPELASTGEALAAELAEEAEAAVNAEVRALNDVLISEGIPADAVFRAINQYWRLERRGLRSALLLESLLISAVSQFETFIARVISESLRFSPQLLKDSGRTFVFSDVTKFKDLEEFTESVSDDYADKLMREPMSRWLRFFGISLRQDAMWVDDYLNEILQRRHIHVHAGGRISAQYLENTREVGTLKIGTRLPVTAEYLQVALDRMAVVVLFLSQASLFAIRESKLAKKVGFDRSDVHATETAFELLVDGRPGAVAELFDKIDSSIWNNSTREHLRANSWLAMKMLGRLPEVRSDIERWDVTLSERLSLAKACLLEAPGAQELLTRLMNAGEITVLDAAIWPLLEPLRRVKSTETPAITLKPIESAAPAE